MAGSVLENRSTVLGDLKANKAIFIAKHSTIIFRVRVERRAGTNPIFTGILYLFCEKITEAKEQCVWEALA